jgi:TetR/AcrR family transcriptional regulator
VNAAVEPRDVRARILVQATRLFAAQGYEGTSIQQVAEAVGITRPTLVYHFGSKEQLRRAVLEQLLAHWKEDLPRVLTAAQTGSDRFRSALDALVSFFRADPDRARLLSREMLDRPKEMTDLFAVHLQPWTSLLTDYIRRGQEEGRTRAAVDPEAYVVQILHAAIGIIATGGATMHILRDPPDLDRQLAELFRIARTSLFNDRPHGA